MFNFLISALALLTLMPSIWATPLPLADAAPAEDPDGIGRLCSSFNTMTLGQLEVQNLNRNSIVMKASYETDPQYPYAIKELNSAFVHTVIGRGSTFTFRRDVELKWVDRDRDFYLFVYNEGGLDRRRVPGKFRIPSKGAKQWTASLKVEREFFGGLTIQEPLCTIARAMGVATTP